MTVQLANPKTLKEETVYKYSNNGKGELHESVIIEGKPYFLKYFKNEDGRDFFKSPPMIEEETRKLIPPHVEEYPYDPYVFNDVKEPNYYLERAKKQTIGTLYQKIKAIVKKYNDIDDKTLNLLSADILATYFQDRFSTVHYIIVVGDNGTGKSAIADTFAALGYRTVVMTNPTKAIWYRVLGYIEYGQVTIVADESEGIEENIEIMSILKDGYQTKHKVPRMDSDNKKPEWYYPFGIKVIICENSPGEYKAKGLVDRSFKIKTYKGLPQYDIKEVRNPQGNKFRQRLLDEIEDFRKLLLVFKLYHRDPLPELDIGVDGRDKELCKPLIQLFYNTESQKEIEETLQYFIDIKNERKQLSLEAVIIPLVINAISVNGNEMSNRELFQLVTDNLGGELDSNNPNIFYTDEGKSIYINTLTKIATDKLGAEKKHGKKNNSILVFNVDYLAKMSKVYGSSNKIQSKLVQDEGDASVQVMHPGDLGKPFYMLDDDEKYKKLQLTSENIEDNGENIPRETVPDPVSASHASLHHPNEEYPQNCYYCNEEFNGIGKKEYQNHVLDKHQGRPCFPGLADLEFYKLKPQGMPWET